MTTPLAVTIPHSIRPALGSPSLYVHYQDADRYVIRFGVLTAHHTPADVAEVLLVDGWSRGGEVVVRWTDGTRQSVMFGRRRSGTRSRAIGGKSARARDGWI